MLAKYLLLSLLIGYADTPIGVWRGESLCTSAATSSCTNEKVVYHIEAVDGKPDTVFVKGNKVVDGKEVEMGSGTWQYDRAKQTLTWEVSKRVWVLKINGKKMDGTLTMPDGTVFRKATLTKD